MEWSMARSEMLENTDTHMRERMLEKMIDPTWIYRFVLIASYHNL